MPWRSIDETIKNAPKIFANSKIIPCFPNKPNKTHHFRPKQPRLPVFLPLSRFVNCISRSFDHEQGAATPPVRTGSFGLPGTFHPEMLRDLYSIFAAPAIFRRVFPFVPAVEANNPCKICLSSQEIRQNRKKYVYFGDFISAGSVLYCKRSSLYYCRKDAFL